ncbi:MAG: hypothetical protein Q4G59_11250 [Planctomycetia bacterium]|nr:hypothetical protein [Planctomycetia bacterium]
MERRDVLKLGLGSTAGVLAAGVVGLDSLVYGDSCKSKACKEGKKMKKYQYPNEHYYKNGVFQTEVAKQAYYEMFADMHYSLGEMLKTSKDFWAVDFGLGDFAHAGMGGIFWVNDKEFRYFGHDIYLLPGQMIPEHFHLAAEGLPAKHEFWQVRHGSIYNFGKGGEKTPEVLAMLPKSQLDAGAVTCFNYKVLNVGDTGRLTAIADPHFMMAGPEGAIVTEYGCYHSMDGLGFTNKKAAL